MTASDLFGNGVEEKFDPNSEWWGMPTFEHLGKPPLREVVVKFYQKIDGALALDHLGRPPIREVVVKLYDDEAIAEFCRLIACRIERDTKSVAFSADRPIKEFCRITGCRIVDKTKSVAFPPTEQRPARRGDSKEVWVDGKNGSAT